MAREIDRLADAGEARPGDVAVFYRTNAQSRVFEEVFIRVGLPYKVVGGVRFYERKEVRDALAYLRAVVNDDDTVSVRRILNTPRRGIGDRAEACVEALSTRDRISFGAALRRAEEAPGISARAANAHRRLRGAARRAARAGRDRAAGGGAGGGAAALRLPRPSWRRAPTRRTQGRVENLQELVSVAREYTERVEAQAARGEDAPSGPPLAGFLEQVALVADADQIPSDDPDHQGVVTLMTLHTAKGLEFPVVFLTGLEDGVFPHLRSLGDTRELEEERRLAYVGITRARQRLYLSRAVTRSAWGAAVRTTRRRGSSTSCPTELVRWERTEAAYTSLVRHGRRRRRPRRRRAGGPRAAASPGARRRRPQLAQRLGVDAQQADHRERAAAGAQGRGRATGSTTSATAWAGCSPSRATGRARGPRSTSATRSYGWCCATPRSRSSAGLLNRSSFASRLDGRVPAGAHARAGPRASAPAPPAGHHRPVSGVDVDHVDVLRPGQLGHVPRGDPLAVPAPA